MPNAKSPHGSRRTAPKLPKPALGPSAPTTPAPGSRDRPPTPRVAIAESTPLPNIDTGEAQLGRTTLIEVQNDLRAAPWPRAPFPTISYHDVPLDAAATEDASGAAAEPLEGARDETTHADDIPATQATGELASRRPRHHHAEPLMAPWHGDDGPGSFLSAPEIRVVEGAELDTVVADTFYGSADHGGIDDTVGRPRRAQAIACDALELYTFVVPQGVLAPKASDEEKRRFIAGRLAHRLPCPIAKIRRIDTRLVEAGATLVRVWCPVE